MAWLRDRTPLELASLTGGVMVLGWLGYTLSTSFRIPEGKRKEMVRVGFPIRKSLDQSLLTAPQRLSQRATSFIASVCQGIHQTPLPHT